MTPDYIQHVKHLLLAAGMVLLASPSMAARPGSAEQPYHLRVMADKPVAYWRMDNSEQETLLNHADPAGGLNARPAGHVRLAAEGPRPSSFPIFSTTNTAAGFGKQPGWLVVKDPGAKSLLDFDLGDAITLEAWVSPSSMSNGGYFYVVGKGRTGNPGLAADNQNYALRLAGGNSGAAISFLFRSRGEKSEYHRWTSTSRLAVGDGWHHVAVSFKFGSRGSLQGYIDGQLVKGSWDMAGDTDRAPVVDDDELWIGSALGGQLPSTFHGEIDEVAIYRSSLSAERIASRYQFVPQPVSFAWDKLPLDAVRVEVYEGLAADKSWKYRTLQLTDSYQTDGFAFFDVPGSYSERGIRVDRASPFLLRAGGWITLPKGPHRLLLRARNAARLSLDGTQIVQTPFFSVNSSAHGVVFPVDLSLAPQIRHLPRGDNEQVVNIEGDGKPHQLLLEAIIGGGNRRPETGEISISLATPKGDFQVLSNHWSTKLTEAAWPELIESQRAWLTAINAQRRLHAGAEEQQYWNQRHRWTRDQLKDDHQEIPEAIEGLGNNNAIDRFLAQQLRAHKSTIAPSLSDPAFLRRLSLDTTGKIPSLAQLDKLLADRQPGYRTRWIDQLLEDPGWADHWVSYWQDVLAENPNIVNPTLNNTGPFRWWIHESLADNKPMDRFVTELVMMEGSSYYGGPAGFALATQNDVPMAAKAHILCQAFLGIQMRCARCHDAPFHDWKQHQLFSLAAMLARVEQKVPASSSVPISADKPVQVEVTLPPGSVVKAAWPFDSHAESWPDELVRHPDDSRAQLALEITHPLNRRFARVLVNRIWQRLMGRGLVEPVDDWANAEPSHPALLDWLAQELLRHDYDMKHLARLILSSHAYQRRSVDPQQASLFAGPARRRMTAEQLVDSLLVVSGQPFDAGPMSADIDGARNVSNSLHLGHPRHSWEFASTSNERDRPSLSLPFAQPYISLLETFGWRGSRQNPVSQRSSEVNVLQPAMLHNGTLSRQVTRLTEDSELTHLALSELSTEQLVSQLFKRILSREPDESEVLLFSGLLEPGYRQRIRQLSEQQLQQELAALAPRWKQLPRGRVSWSNHLNIEANKIKQQLEAAVRRGPPASPRLDNDWRLRMEDMVWVLMNSPEFIFLP
jgi:hypothetical protein